jgi:toxin ParE1/3/4
MKLSLRRSDDFNEDFDRQYRWYLAQAGEIVAERYLGAVLTTLQLLAEQPKLGRRRKFQHPALRELRAFRLVAPFGVHLLFYRVLGKELVAERLMHGSRDLPRRLTETPGSEP